MADNTTTASTWWTTKEGAVTYALLIGRFGTIRLADRTELHIDLDRGDAPEEELIRAAMTDLRARTRRGAPRGGRRPRIKAAVTEGTVQVIRNLRDVTTERRYYVTALEVVS